jgi:hypothetical protein
MNEQTDPPTLEEQVIALKTALKKFQFCGGGGCCPCCGVHRFHAPECEIAGLLNSDWASKHKKYTGLTIWNSLLFDAQNCRCGCTGPDNCVYTSSHYLSCGSVPEPSDVH